MTDAPKTIADTPQTPAMPPPNKIEQVKGFIGDLARPFAIYSTAFAVAKAIWTSPKDPLATGVITAAGGILVLLYGAKSAEVAFKSNSDAKVQVAQANTVTS